MRNLLVILTGWRAKVAELVDALALGASGVTRESSSLSFRTKSDNLSYCIKRINLTRAAQSTAR